MDDRRRFDATPESVAVARRFVADALATWGRDDAVSATTLVVSELATNAVRHAHSEYVVDVTVDDVGVQVGVSDGSTAPPRMQSVGIRARGGRGLAIVDKVCKAWGVEERPSGKRIWCVVDAAGAADGGRS
jgi:anti-sigma regulatory factor (Ser/Thr protein kinase)